MQMLERLARIRDHYKYSNAELGLLVGCDGSHLRRVLESDRPALKLQAQVLGGISAVLTNLSQFKVGPAMADVEEHALRQRLKEAENGLREVGVQIVFGAIGGCSFVVAILFLLGVV